MHPTSTAKWSLVVQRVSTTTARVWVGTLFGQLEKPKRARVVLRRGDRHVQTVDISTRHWQRPFRDHERRFYHVAAFEGLSPGVRYEVRFEREVNDGWQFLRKGEFTTLPRRLPTDSSRPFTIGLGSCFYEHYDGGRAAESYKALYDKRMAHSPDVTFLAGDQVYLDIGFDSLSADPGEIRERIADDYADNWQAMGSILSRGATWMVPDDHEYWNNYPNYKSNIPTLWRLKKRKVREAWSNAAYDGVTNVQQALPVETFAIGNDVSFCIADLRSYRDEDKHFLHPEHMAKLTNWARSLTGPGVLLGSQPLLVDANTGESNLRSYGRQYVEMIEAFASTPHDIVLLSGDVHFGRIAEASLGESGGRLIEIVSSPLSNLTYLNGLATAKPKTTPKRFPPRGLFVRGVSPSRVKYHRKVSTVSKWFDPYPRTRTREHFMTVSLHRVSGGVRLRSLAWRIRDQEPSRMPRKDFFQFSTLLT